MVMRPIKDDKPPHGEEVLVRVREPATPDEYSKTTWDSDKWNEKKEKFDGDATRSGRVTHWMPLPLVGDSD